MPLPDVLLPALLSGALMGFVLALVGGGGSILAVPLLVYAVGVDRPHVAIGTSAMAVALNAALGAVGHARHGNVRWRCAIAFALAGMAGAALGAEAGKALDGERLLALFGALMVVVGGLMLRGRRSPGDDTVRMTSDNAAALLLKLMPAGLGVGLLAGFFGIGGGFLIVPALMLATGLPIGLAIGSSLPVIAMLGATTAASYALSGLGDWRLVALLLAGGAAGSLAGRRASAGLATRKRLLEQGFAAMVVGVGAWVAWQGLA